MKQRARRTKDIIDSSQHTQIKEVNQITQNKSLMFFIQVKKLSSRGEQTSKEIIRINRCLEEAYENNHSSFFVFILSKKIFDFLIEDQPISFFMFTIHPTLFSRSVENIFHVSFLIKVRENNSYVHLIQFLFSKEGKAELLLDNNELPVLRKLENKI